MTSPLLKQMYSVNSGGHSNSNAQQNSDSEQKNSKEGSAIIELEPVAKLRPKLKDTYKEKKSLLFQHLLPHKCYPPDTHRLIRMRTELIQPLDKE